MLRALILSLSLLMCALPAAAQDAQSGAAMLIADEVFITADRTLVAQGNVEAFQNGARLQASAVRYSQDTGRLVIEGPITLTEDGQTLIFADAGELDADLRNGILTGARVILNRQLQIATLKVDRVDGRYNQLTKASITSCKVCDDGRAPLWQIRAKRVIHDQLEQQLYLDSAQFRILNVPVFYLPRLRLPGPRLERASGFLVPSIRTTSQLGTGLKLPYFIKLGDHRDLTVTPYVSSVTRTLELRYRQAFRTGRIELNAAVTRDDQRPDTNRGYLFGNGTFSLPRDYQLTFDIEATTDRAYLNEYGYFDQDRLESQITVSRARRDALVRASLYNFESLRADDINDNLPTVVVDGEYERRFFPKSVGGEVRLRLEAHAHRRNSDLDTDGPDDDLVTDGRDVARLHARADYLRRFTWSSGVVADVQAGISANIFDITQDASFDQNHFDLVPQAAVALRYPMLRRGRDGITQMLEPVVQLGWTRGSRLEIPNDESTRIEFDEGNLLSLSRFPRPDRRERGTVGAVGLNWSRINPQGWDSHISVGQVFRADADPSFTASSGLDGVSSDILLAGRLRSPGGIWITGRSLIDGDLNLSKAEVRGNYGFARGAIGGSYVWLKADEAEDRTEDVSEILLNGRYEINNHWAVNADWRFNVADDRAATAGLGLSYDNECVAINMTVARSYSSSTAVEPTTEFGFNVGLRGFAASSGDQRYIRSCKR
ncbi:Organic solvent tolerance protein [Sulfitobacter noctilucicola]|uniref:LPS-assembly protein LptD n=1 Tax=Sulfitobacter noctilucicola TaxID=1342301 RepID=A0A7W6M7R2_9RHOB|nr:LPS assembly protein LptD [Sulfitobacter noctilucicola]KIN64875.1 Organic solvent tolerance protein [Sulfitobacter noctilucicola]MBB4173981.1 LPS-assembly protein [Sulfitobacter noctilucicola]